MHVETRFKAEHPPDLGLAQRARAVSFHRKCLECPLMWSRVASNG
jgi:hypothetical protein